MRRTFTHRWACLLMATTPAGACTYQPGGDVSFAISDTEVTAETASFTVGDAPPDETGHDGETGFNEHDGLGDDTDDPLDDPAPECGNGVREPGEACDGSDFGETSCATHGFAEGELHCTESCAVNLDGCHTCGDGIKESSETCDGEDVDAQTCHSQGFAGGTLGCNADCQSFDTSMCDLCGNDVIDPGEECDGANLDGHTCQTQGYEQGQLHCTSGCTFDTAGCSNTPTCGTAGQSCTAASDCCNGVCILSMCV